MENQFAVLNEERNDLPRVTVSLTTYPARIDRVHIAIESLLMQTVPADRVVLWLAREQFPDGEESLPPQLLEQKNRGLVIEWCDKDIRSYKKIIPPAEKWPEDIIITADDDLVYEITAVERLLESYRKHPDCVSTLRAHLMLFDEEGTLLPYEQWIAEYSAFVDEPLMALFPTTGGGMLFPPSVLPEQAFDSEVFMDICPMADDVWIKMMMTIAGIRTVLADTNTRLQYVDGTQEESLYSYNKNGNDEQIAAVLEKYNRIGGEEYPEDTLLRRMNDLSDHVPDTAFSRKNRKEISLVNEKTGIKVSVIVCAENSGGLRRFMRCLSAQTLADIEIICVDNGSRDDTAEILKAAAGEDGRIKIITLPERLSPTAARRAAVMTCKGEYCIFPDVEGVLAPDACEQLYAAAEAKDADIFSFTCGVIDRQGEAVPVHQGHKGILRNRNLVPKEFEKIEAGADRLSRCIFSGRLTRRAYLHASEEPIGGTLYDYFLLCRFSEMFVGEESPIFYALPSGQKCMPEHEASAAAAIEKAVAFGHTEERFSQVVAGLRRRLMAGELEYWYGLLSEERSPFLSRFIEEWGASASAAALAKMSESKGEEVLRRAALCINPSAAHNADGKVGVVISRPDFAGEIFAMTDLLDCIAVHRPTVLVGVSREKASAAVISARTACAGEDLWNSENIDAFDFAECFERVLNEHDVCSLVLNTGAKRFAQMVMHARLRGIAVTAVMSEPFYYAMNSCSRPTAGISALRLASVVVTGSPSQQRLMDVLGVPVRYVPLPALRLMGGRSSSRAAENIILWTGCAGDSVWRMNDAVDIFRLVKKKIPDARMIMCLDGEVDLEEMAQAMDDGIVLRRLRPDYGIFSDASLQLVTGYPGLTDSAVRAGRALGVPAVMYRYLSEQESGVGGVLVQEGDIYAAAEETVRLLGSKQLREQLGAQGKVNAGTVSREEAARRWNDVMGEAAELNTRGIRLPEDELGRVLGSVMSGYEDGAKRNADILESFRERCARYEQQLTDAEERRQKETEALKSRHEKTEKELRAKERECRAQLEDIRSSTIYKAGSLLTFVPRWIKKQLLRLKNGQ